MKPVSAQDLVSLDKNLKVEVLQCYPLAEQVIWQAAKNDYSEDVIYDKPVPKDHGKWIVESLLANDRGHFGPLEHPSITFNCVGFVHSVMVQARTHRLMSFDCLAEESLIDVKYKKKKKLTIKDLYEKYSSNEELPLIKSLNEDRGYFEYSKIGKVFKNSEKDLYQVTLDDGKQLKCSMDHRIFTDNGWMRLKELNIGDNVACNGVNVSLRGVKLSVRGAREWYSNPIWLSEQLKEKSPKTIASELGCSYEVIKKYAYLFGITWEYRRDHNTGKKLDTSHFTEEQINRRRLNGINNIKLAHLKNKENHPSRKYDDFTENRVYNWQKYSKSKILDHHGRVCNNCGTTENLHCHHIIPVKDNIKESYNLDNYEILCSSCHVKEHKSLRTHFRKIVSIEYLRTDVTYDIEVDSKYHNFVCDGIVVHNCQSQRYTGRRVQKVANGLIPIEDVFYLRPPGFYIDRQGDRYTYTEEDIQEDLADILLACQKYDRRRLQGYNEEHIRDLLPQGIRQNFVVTMNLRSALHFMDLRAKRDAQLEIQALCEMLWPKLKSWAPNVCEYYEEKRLHKAKLSP